MLNILQSKLQVASFMMVSKIFNRYYPAGVTVTMKRKGAVITVRQNIPCGCARVNYKYYFSPHLQFFKMWFHISFNAKWFIA